MATTEFVKNYKDVIVVYDYNKSDYKTLLKAGYKPNEEGGIEVEMLFGDGIAYDTQMNGIVMRYPTLLEVSQNEALQQKIWNTTCRNEIIPYDVALACGKVGKYKYVLNYPEWYKREGEEYEKWNMIFAVCVDRGEWDEIFFDVFEDELEKMAEKDIVKVVDGSYVLMNNPSDEQIHTYAAMYGILWTEHIGDTFIKRKGVPHRGVEVQRVTDTETLAFA